MWSAKAQAFTFTSPACKSNEKCGGVAIGTLTNVIAMEPVSGLGAHRGLLLMPGGVDFIRMTYLQNRRLIKGFANDL